MQTLEQLSAYRCPAFGDYPSIPLYRDQVLAFLNQALSPLWDGEEVVTASMINNYVKLKVLPAPAHKRYSREQVVQLYLINLFKQVLTMAEIRTLLALDFPAENMAEGYARFCRRLEAELGALTGETMPPESGGHPAMEAAVRSLVYRRCAAVLLEQGGASLSV